MSSTDSPSSAKALDAFISLAERIGRDMRSSGTPFFDVPPGDARSYFVKRAGQTVSRAALEAPACANAKELEQKLEAMWNVGVIAPLVELAPAAAALAEALRTERKGKDEDGDVTPFVYAMF